MATNPKTPKLPKTPKAPMTAAPTAKAPKPAAPKTKASKPAAPAAPPGTAGQPPKPILTMADLPIGWRDLMLKTAAEGASDIEIRQVLRMNINRWYAFLKEHEEFKAAVDQAHDLCFIWWERHGRALATGRSRGNALVWIVNMKNRFKWRNDPTFGGGPAPKGSEDETPVGQEDDKERVTRIEIVGVKVHGDREDPAA